MLRDVGMIERREQLRLAAEARKAIGLAGDGRQQDLDRDVAIQLQIACAIHLAHTAGADGGEDLCMTETSTGSRGHARCRISGTRPF